MIRTINKLLILAAALSGAACRGAGRHAAGNLTSGNVMKTCSKVILNKIKNVEQ